MVVRISDKAQNYSKVTKLLVKPNFNPTINELIGEFDIPVYPIMYRLTQKAYEILKSKHK